MEFDYVIVHGIDLLIIIFLAMLSYTQITQHQELSARFTNHLRGKFYDMVASNVHNVDHSDRLKSALYSYLSESAKVTAEVVKKAWSLPPAYLREKHVIEDIGRVNPFQFYNFNEDFYRECVLVNEWARAKFIEYIPHAPRNQYKYQRWLEQTTLSIFEQTIIMKHRAFLKHYANS